MSLIDNFEEASKQVGTEHNSLQVVDHVAHIVLPASYLGKIKHAVGLLLNGKLHNYSSTLHALPIAYNNKKVKLLSRVGTIIGTQPCVHFDVQTEFVIFKPSLNDILKCTVHKKQHGRIGCLVHGYFYASVSCSQNDSPDVGDIILFKVTKLEDDGYGFLSIIGEYQSTIQHAEIPEEESQKENVELDSGIDDDHTLNKSMSVVPRDEGEVISSSPLLFPECEPSPPEVAEEEDLTDLDGEKKKVIQDSNPTVKNHVKKIKKKKKEKKEKKQKKHKKKKKKTVESVPNNDDESSLLHHSTSVATAAPEIAQSEKESKSEYIPVRVVNESSSALQSWLRNEVPSEEPKIGNEVPSEEPKIGNGVPSEEPNIRNEVPFEEPKIRNEVPSEESTIWNEIPSEKPKIRNEVPSEEPKIRNEIPSEERKIRNEIPLEESKIKKQESEELGSGMFGFSQSVDDLLTFEKKPSKKSSTGKKRKRKEISDRISKKTTEIPSGNDAGSAPGYDAGSAHGDDANSVLPDTNVSTDPHLVTETSPKLLKVKILKNKKLKDSNSKQLKVKEKKLSDLPDPFSTKSDSGLTKSALSITDEVKSVFSSVDAQIPSKIAKQMKKLDKMLKREEKRKKREEKAKRKEERRIKKEEKMKKREAKKLRKEKRLKKQQRKEKTKSLKIKRPKNEDEKESEIKLVPSADDTNTPSFPSFVASLLQNETKATKVKSKKRKLNDSESTFLPENLSPKKARKAKKHKKKKN